MERHFLMISRALNARKRKIFALFFALAASIGLSWATTYVTITQNDFPGMDVSFTKDGVTVSADWIDNMQSGNLVAPGSFSTTLGNFTKIEVNAGEIGSLGEGWSGNPERQTWTGNASSVSFSGDIMGLGHGITIMCTIEESGSSTPAWVKPGDSWDESTKTLTVNSNPGNYAYGEAEDIEHLIISSTVTEIGEQAFAMCINLETIDFSEGLQNINNEAFTSCEKLESVILPSTLKWVGTLVFSYDEKLKSVTINAPSLDYYGSLAFEYTHADLKIYVPAESVATYKTNWSGYTDRIEAIGGGSANTEVTITQDDFPKFVTSFTKDGVTVSAGDIDGFDGNLTQGGSFSTTLGNFTQIEVNAANIGSLGTGWSGNAQKMTWTGNASSVSFSGDIMGYGHGTTLKFTIEAATPAPDPTEGIEVPEGGEIFVLTDSIMKREEGEFMFAYDGEGWVTECQYMIWHTQTMNAESRWNRTTMNMVGTDGPEFGSNKANVVRLEINFASTTGGGALADGWSLSGNKYIWTGSSKSVRFYHTGATISGITSVVYVFDGKCHRDPQRFTTSVLAEDLIVGDTLAMGAQLISEVYGGFYLDANRVRYHGVVQTQNFRSTFSQLGAVSKHGAMDNEYPENRGCLEPINENGELGEEWIVISLDPLHIAGIGTASAVTNTCYTSEVDYAALEPGDTIAYGASIINTPEKVWFRANRMQRSNSGETFIIEDDRYMEGSYGTFGKNGVITDKYGTTFAPINEQGTLGGKWVVVFYSPLTIAGIGEPAIELTLSKDVSIIGLPIAGINDIGDNNYEVEPGTQFQIQAAPAPAHYSFVGWSDLASTDPNYSANPRTIVADKNLTIEPIFAIDTYIVTLASNDSTMGTLRVEGAGGSNIGPKEEINIYHGVVGEHYQVLGEYSGSSWIGVGGNDNKTITVESLNGEIIDNITLEVYMPSHWTGYSIAATSGEVSGDVANYQDLVITNINATSVTLSRVGEGENGGSVLFSEIIVNGRDEQQGGSAEPITVTWNNSNLPSSGNANSFTLDGVTITCGGIGIDWGWKDFQGNGTFTTDLGNFTKIEVTAEYCEMAGEGWSGVSNKMTWTGNAASVSYNGSIMGCLSIVFTIEPTAAPAAATGIVDNGDGTYTVDWGTEMSIIAEPAEGYMLASWNGEPALSDTLKQTVEGALSINATFKHIPAVITLPEGVSIVAPVPAGITAKGEGVYEVEYGTEFQISADSIPEHYHFGHWADLADSVAQYSANPRTIVAGENLTIEPIFAIDTYTLTLATNDSTKGVVSVIGAGSGAGASVGEMIELSEKQTENPVMGEYFQVAGEGVNYQGRIIGRSDDYQLTISSQNGEKLDFIILKVSSKGLWSGYTVSSTAGDVEDLLDNFTVRVSNINATSVTISRSGTTANPTGYIIVSTVYVNEEIPLRADITDRDFPNSGNVLTGKGVTLTAGSFDLVTPQIVGGGTFTTDLGNFTKIEIYAKRFSEFSGEGWTEVGNSGRVWTGKASSVSFGGAVIGEDMESIYISYTIAPASAASGIVDNGDGTYTVDYGTELTFVAKPAEGFMLESWNSEPATSDTLKLTMNGELAVNATFAHVPYTITLPEGVSIVGMPIDGITAKGEGVYEVEPGTEFQISADGAPEHYHFGHWADLDAEDAMYAANPRTIVASENLTVEPFYAIDTYTLTLATNDSTKGVVSLEGAGQGGQAEPITVTWYSYDLPSSGSSFTKDGVTLTCDIDDSDLYGPGTFTTDLGNFTQIVVSGDYACLIEATGGWSGNRDQKTWTGNAAIVPFDGNIYAFSSDVTFVFTIEDPAAPAAATGIVDNGDGTYTVDYGTELTFVAKPAEGFMLESWSNGAEVTGDTLKLTMTEELSLTANFKHIPAVITLPEGVSIVGMPIEGITSKGEGVYEVEYGTEFQISADIIPEHYHFGHWADLNSEDAQYAANPRTIVAGENLTIEPIFAIDTYTLTLATNDSTMGVVSLEGAGQGGLQEPSAQLIVPESWSSEVGVTITAADLPGFVASTEEAVKALPVPTEGSVFVIYNFKDDGGVEAVTFENGEYVRTTSTPVDHANASYYSNQGMIFLYTTAAGQAGQGGEGGEGEEQEGIVDNGDGTYTVDWGTELSIVAVPAKDYHLVSWNGEPAVSDTMKVTVTEEISLSAQFKHDTYILTVEGAEVEIAKFADGTTDAVVLNPGTLVGVQEGDSVKLTTTATFSSANVADNLDITLHYAIEVIEDGIYDNEYALAITDSIYPIKGAIIEPMTPDEDAAPEDEEADVKEGLEIYAYGYCNGSSYSINYYLKSGQPDQYKIEFADSRFTNVAYEETSITGREGTIDIEIPVDLPTGDYSMTITFRDSRYEWLESNPITVSFHVNLPETYVVALFDNVIAVVDTCECLTDIQWYWRADASEPWTLIEGATGYYYKMEGGLTGEFFIKAKMNGVDTYTCPQEDLSLYGDTKQAKVSAYPNPVQSTTTVTIEGSNAWQHSMRIVSLMGNVMMNGSFEGNTTSVEMGTFPQGHYMISVDGITVKVMKK